MHIKHDYDTDYLYFVADTLQDAAVLERFYGLLSVENGEDISIICNGDEVMFGIDLGTVETTECS